MGENWLRFAVLGTGWPFAVSQELVCQQALFKTYYLLKVILRFEEEIQMSYFKTKAPNKQQLQEMTNPVEKRGREWYHQNPGKSVALGMEGLWISVAVEAETQGHWNSHR